MFRDGESGGADADLGQFACTGSGDGPPVLRESLQDFESAGEGNYAFDVFDFAALDFAIFGGVVGVGEEFADGGEAGAAVGLADDFVGNEAVFIRPDGPYAGNGGGGVYQDAVEIEEHTSALNFHRSMIPSFDSGLCVLAPRNAVLRLNGKSGSKLPHSKNFLAGFGSN
ncbi:MAG: hypothetical protein JWO71_529 [Candidatus Acidoferrum typicum]|nr:hypothetical protein [Candidatus Acidoferrum typicum]